MYVFLVSVFQIRVEFRTSTMEYKMDLFAKIVHGYGPVHYFHKKLHPADSKPLLNYSKSQAADLFANYGPIGTFSK